MEEYIVTVDDEGTITWRQDNKIHRIDGPAVIRADGTKIWYEKDKIHRIDGPAIKNINGYKAWYINGIEYSQDEFDEIINPKVKELTMEEVSSLLGYEVKIIKSHPRKCYGIVTEDYSFL